MFPGWWFSQSSDNSTISTKSADDIKSIEEIDNSSKRSRDSMRRVRLRNKEYDKQKRMQLKQKEIHIKDECRLLKNKIYLLQQKCSAQEFVILNAKQVLQFLLKILFRMQPNIGLNAENFIIIVESMYFSCREEDRVFSRSTAGDFFNVSRSRRLITPPVWWIRFWTCDMAVKPEVINSEY